MATRAGHHWRLSCRCDDGCGWSRDVVVAHDADTRAVLLVALRAHADVAKHGRVIEGAAFGLNSRGDPAVLILRHP